MLWVTSAEMVSAVSEAGGLGTLGVNCGYDTKVYSLEETAERMREQIRKIKTLTNKPFAFNYMSGGSGTNLFSEACLQVALEEEVTHVVLIDKSEDVNRDEIRRLKNYGLKVIFRALNPTIKNAKAAEAAGVDVIVATGFDEGGGAPARPIGTMSIVPVISDAVNIPVMAAGGIVDYRGVKASFALGAEGVFVGTAFITSVESPASEITKKAIIQTESHEMVTLKTMLGYEHCLPTKAAVERPEEMENATMENFSNSFLNGFIKGNLDESYITVNSAISLIKEIKTCKEIINDLFTGVSFAH